MTPRRRIVIPLAAALMVGPAGCHSKTDDVIPYETKSPVERGPVEGAGGVPPDTPLHESTYPTTTPPPEGPPPEGRPGGPGEDRGKAGGEDPTAQPDPGANSAEP
jgi:hypothetical protein